VDPVIAMRGVEKQYGALRPLRIRSLELPARSSTMLLGLDRPAAETFINLITGATLPEAGEVISIGRSTREIVDSTDPGFLALKQQELLLPYFEFKHLVNDNESDVLRVTYLHEGQQHKVECLHRECDDTELGTPHSRLRRAFFYFRAVDKGPKMHCRH